MMKAIVKQSKVSGDLMLTDMPIPAIDENEMLVKVKAIGVGIHDEYFLPSNIEYPFTIGIEAAGIVEKIGNNVVGFEIEDKITFISMMQLKGGTWAEFAVVAKDALIVKIPEGMGFTQAAAIPVAGNTALRAFRSLPLFTNGSLFIAGASGAIGTFAIQLAVSRGYVVAASASKKNHEFMLALGATMAVDYRDPDWVQQIKQWKLDGVDAALAIQPETGLQSMDVVRDRGRLITISGDDVKPDRNIKVEQVSHDGDVKKDLVAMMQKIAENKIQVVIEEKYSFEDGIDAWKKTVTRHARGKLVIVMDE